MRTTILVAAAAATASLATGASLSLKEYATDTCTSAAILESVYNERACIYFGGLYARASCANGTLALQNYGTEANCLNQTALINTTAQAVDTCVGGTKLYCNANTLSTPNKPQAQEAWKFSFEAYSTFADCGAGNVAKATSTVAPKKVNFCFNSTHDGLSTSTFSTCDSARQQIWEYNKPGCPDADFAGISSYLNNQCLAMTANTTAESGVYRCSIPAAVTLPAFPGLSDSSASSTSSASPTASASPVSAASALRPSLVALLSLVIVSAASLI
ncbi:uncharacterized protein EV422DRAFT_531917 [Fimicolochytrium jonesii]|uniref:uncharacterized protein n=1 Tax=Fimicolochytrium jonesii TaxID=1396493 RepID=UPI0022FF26ED|nr:uncharacterized protein EV422DRAFT_531917 [Fimicolochytrium jonesii]KAI8820178.1 hypothetical protein EV422DRAFT_531917 [Fimicolochytrium jonesii]